MRSKPVKRMKIANQLEKYQNYFSFRARSRAERSAVKNNFDLNLRAYPTIDGFALFRSFSALCRQRLLVYHGGYTAFPRTAKKSSKNHFVAMVG